MIVVSQISHWVTWYASLLCDSNAGAQTRIVGIDWDTRITRIDHANGSVEVGRSARMEAAGGDPSAFRDACHRIAPVDEARNASVGLRSAFYGAMGTIRAPDPVARPRPWWRSQQDRNTRPFTEPFGLTPTDGDAMVDRRSSTWSESTGPRANDGLGDVTCRDTARLVAGLAGRRR